MLLLLCSGSSCEAERESWLSAIQLLSVIPTASQKVLP